MFISLKKFLILGGLLGVGGLGVTAVHVATEKTISESLGEYRVVDQENNEDVWTKLESKLKGTETGTPTPKTKVFGDLKNDTNSTGGLKILCQVSKSKVYWNIFSKDSDLLEDVKNFCAITIEEVLDSKKLNVEKTVDNNPDKSKYENKLDSLKDHETNKQGQKLDEDLTELKEKMNKASPSKEQLWPELLKWCSKSYKSYFFNKSDDLWKNVDTYCKE